MGGADAVLAASVFHDRRLTVAEVKAGLAAAEVPVRPIGRGPREQDRAKSFHIQLLPRCRRHMSPKLPPTSQC